MTRRHFASVWAVGLLLTGCAAWKPAVSRYDSIPHKAIAQENPPRPVRIVEIPEPLALPDQLKLIPADAKPRLDKETPRLRVDKANHAARIEPSRANYINAVQVYPFADGALYQVYAAPAEVTDVELQAGETLVGNGPVAAGDTVRWIIGNTESGSGSAKRIHILLKPTQADLSTNLVINTDRRTYHLELHAMEKTYMAVVSFAYPQDELIAITANNDAIKAMEPVQTGVDVNALSFRYVIEGDNPPWRPLRAFDDGKQVFIAFPPGIAEGEMPPLWIIGAQGDGELVNYRIRGTYMIVDRLFATAELRLGAGPQQVVRIVCKDGKNHT